METNKAPVYKLQSDEEWEELKPFLRAFGCNISYDGSIRNLKGYYLLTNYCGKKGEVDILSDFNRPNSDRELHLNITCFKHAVIKYMYPDNYSNILKSGIVISNLKAVIPASLRVEQLYSQIGVNPVLGQKSDNKKESFKLYINKKPIKLNFKL